MFYFSEKNITEKVSILGEEDKMNVVIFTNIKFCSTERGKYMQTQMAISFDNNFFQESFTI